MRIYPLKRSICKNCYHRIFWDYETKSWKHKNYLHNDNCQCRNPEVKNK